MRSRICACTVTSSAVVGSSAMSRRGSQESDSASMHALAHAAGQLVRVVAEPPLGVGDPDQLEQLHARAWRAARLLIERCKRIVSTSCVPMVNAGFRLVIGSWNAIADLVAAHLAHLVERERQEVAPVEHHRAAGDASRR